MQRPELDGAARLSLDDCPLGGEAIRALVITRQAVDRFRKGVAPVAPETARRRVRLIDSATFSRRPTGWHREVRSGDV